MKKHALCACYNIIFCDAFNVKATIPPVEWCMTTDDIKSLYGIISCISYQCLTDRALFVKLTVADYKIGLHCMYHVFMNFHGHSYMYVTCITSSTLHTKYLESMINHLHSVIFWTRNHQFTRSRKGTARHTILVALEVSQYHSCWWIP